MIIERSGKLTLDRMKKNKKIISYIKIPKVADDCLLFYAQNPDHIPFPIKRIYFITNADSKLPRGYHAHKKNRQVAFCIQGSVKLVLDNGKKRESVLLSNPQKGVEIPQMTWHEMHNFKKNTILLIFASEKFDTKDYIRDYRLFLKVVAKNES